MGRGQVHEYELESFDSRSVLARARPRERFLSRRGAQLLIQGPMLLHLLYRRSFGGDSEPAHRKWNFNSLTV